MDRPGPRTTTLFSPWHRAFVVGLSYFVAAYFSLEMTQGSTDIAAIWPASGVALAAVLLVGPQQRVSTLAGIAVASLTANMLAGTPLLTSVAFTLANLLEVVVVSSLMFRVSPRWTRFDSVRTSLVFIAAATVGGLSSATLAIVLTGVGTLGFFVSWFTTVVLGTLIVTPLLVTMFFMTRAETRIPNLRRIAQLGALTVILTAASFAIFNTGAYYLMFLPLLGVVIATYAFGPTGSALTISAIAFAMIIGVGETPVSAGLNLQMLGLQFYLLCLIGAAWPLTAMLAEKERLIRSYAETNALLELAESTAHVGHWFIRKDIDEPVWSDEVFRIHGVKPARQQRLGLTNIADAAAFKLYHKDDRERVRTILVGAMERAVPFEYQARIVRPDGSIRHVHSIGKPHYDRKGRFDGLFGTFHDVSEHTETLEKLHLARREALHEASEAKRLSETDPLTGIANRRKILSSLDTAASHAIQCKSPLCVGIVDIDHFKSVNDRFGHAMGDAVLKRIAEIIQSVSGMTYYVGRLGGEEFLVVLPDINERGGVALLQLISAKVACENWGQHGPDTITVSTGLAQLGPEGDVNAALTAADNALYEAKSSGRNAVRHAGTVLRFGGGLPQPDNDLLDRMA